MHADSAAAFVAAAQGAFLEAGFLLFSTSERAANGLATDGLALYPGNDPYAVMRAMETNAANYEHDTDDVIAWFHHEESQYPIRFTAIAFDYVGGVLQGEVLAATAFAQRFIAFCPDVDVAAGPLGRDFKKTREIYCWWD
ncbi:MAG: DUF4253 domain-containing protein [Gemmatimonadaceae bacterium]